MQNSKKKGSIDIKRNQTMDIAKGISIYLVVAFHLEAASEHIVYFDALAMPVFFFISGVFFSKYYLGTPGGEFSQLRKKTKRLLRPFVIWSVIAIVCNCLMLAIAGNPDLLISRIQHEIIEIIVQARSYWFLICLFYTFAYSLLCRAISNRLFKTSNKAGLIIVSLVGYIALYIFVFDDPSWSILRFYKFQWLYPFFLLGSCMPLSSIMDKIYLLTSHKVVFVLTVAVCISAAFFFADKDGFALWMHPHASVILWNPRMIALQFIYYCIAFLGVICVLGLSNILSHGAAIGHAFSTVGLLSFDIYILHMFFVKPILAFTPEFIMQSALLVHIYAFAVGALITFVIVVLVNHLLLKLRIYSDYCR